MNEIFHFLKSWKSINELGNIHFPLGKIEFWTHYELPAYGRTFCHSKGPEWKYRLFIVLSKQTTSQMKTLQVQVYIQQWFYDEQGTRFVYWRVIFIKWILVQLILIGVKMVQIENRYCYIPKVSKCYAEKGYLC